MVTAVELNSSINAASTREDLSRLRSTARRLRTNNCKKRTEVQERLADNDIDDNKLALLETEEATLEAEIIALSGAADNASSKINALMRETCMVNSATLSADDSNNNATATPTSTESVSGLVRALSSALSRRPYDSRTKRADINRLPMQGRSLIDPYQLPAHFRRLEKWFASNEFGTFDDSTKAFVADKEVEAQLVEKAIESLSSHRNVASEANTLVDTYGATWNHLKNTLIDKFAKPEDIRRELNRKISQLTYKGHSNVDGFISELRQIHTLASTVNSSPEDSVYFIDDILRDLIKAWCLVCVGLDSVTLSGRLVYEATPVSTQLPAAPSLATIYLVDDTDPKSLVSLPPVVAPPDPPTQLCNQDKKLALDILQALVAKGWRDLPLSRGYRCRIRELCPVEHLDSPHQTHVGELFLPASTLSTRPSPRNFATPLFKRLSPDLKVAYNSMIEDYVTKKWWVSAPATTTVSPTPAANVFLINGSKRPRLVCDLRACNAALPRASSRNPDLWKVLSIIRLTGPSIIVGADISSAFYAIRISAESGTTHFVLHTALGTFWSTRSLFGTSIGPSSLSGTLGSSVEAVKNCSSVLQSPSVVSVVSNHSDHGDTHTRYPVDLTSNLQYFADDIVCSGFICTIILHLMAILLQVLVFLAFNCQPKKCAILTTEDNRQEAEKTCKQFGLLFPIAEVIGVLGVVFSYTAICGGLPARLCMSCDAASRMAKAMDFLKKDPVLAQRPSKIDIFAVGGKLSFDQGRVHGERRLISDLLKVIIARNFPSSPWHQHCDLTTMPSTEQQAYEAVVLWAREVCESSSSCRHLSPLRSKGQSEVTIIVETDASLYGGATVVRIDDDIILQDVYRFSARQISYSSNRRELLMCLQGIRRAAELISYHRTTLTALTKCSHLIFNVDFRTDNKSSCSWLSNDEAVLKLQSSKILERRAIIRLIDSISEELKVIRQYGRLSLSHLAGATNHYADSASRLLDRPVKTGTTTTRLGELLAAYKKSDNLKPSQLMGSDKGECAGEHCCWAGSISHDEIRLMVNAASAPAMSLREDLPSISHEDLEEQERDLEGDFDSCCCLIEDDDPTGGIAAYDRQPFSMIASITSGSDDFCEDVCRAVDCVLAIRDDLGQNPPAPHPTAEPLIEAIARDSWDVDSVLDRVHILRLVLSVLRSNAQAPNATVLECEWNQAWNQEDVLCAAHSAQFNLVNVHS
ncbi:hypothetical protein Pmar_PMAR029707 [Perkinsus marinus ATCC 50983]|uniref:Reverse transcriptase domain-containing protein n=1 Tax=Perkinsus marinus (strain ATCC 50983 / TXsc) TaxID=423536 RepID=C5KQJ2_PERM5|nr:hypothetical protein Pmar_PMAR029707 [Perkinsus marinus ATCC 50983]EER13268.1 hypothetical protein Pmar_PMAR029707 [Perkinsus marinus ATCC 50983]|eukprot:XP_002781473.1 hypothetical protein Pmar_PMAR029707 [Perkinsus marinus ATCC 50983]